MEHSVLCFLSQKLAFSFLSLPLESSLYFWKIYFSIDFAAIAGGSRFASFF